jgi:hypothetical protein
MGTRKNKFVMSYPSNRFEQGLRRSSISVCERMGVVAFGLASGSGFGKTAKEC